MSLEQTLQPTSALEAVNDMLGSIGQGGVNSLESNESVDANIAVGILVNTSREVQERGWFFNTDYNYPLVPDADGEIKLPPGMLQFEPDDSVRGRIVERSRKLYDRENHTFLFEAGTVIYGRVVWLLGFEDLPQAARTYIHRQAGRAFQSQRAPDQILYAFTREREEEALTALSRAQLRADRPNAIADNGRVLSTVASSRLQMYAGSAGPGTGASTVVPGLAPVGAPSAIDVALRADLADVGATKGADMVAYIADGSGALARTIQAKLRDFVTPEDFGAIGDGTDRPVSQWLVGGEMDRGYGSLGAIQQDYPHVSDLSNSVDWAGFQAAINHCATSGKPLRPSGDYCMNRGLNVNTPIHLDGAGWGQLGAVSSPAFTSGCRITATAAVAAILLVTPLESPDAIHGVQIRNLILDGNNLAQRLLQADSCTRSCFENIDGARCTIVGFDFTDRLGYYFYKNRIDRIRYNSTASAAAADSDGVWFRDTVAAAGGIVQNHVGWIETFTVNGDGVVIGGADNNNFGSLTCNTSTGTGAGIRFKGPTGFGYLAPRNNFIDYAGGSVVDETNDRSNVIRCMPSEATSLTRTGTGGETLPRIFNYVTGHYWSVPDNKLRDVLQFGASDLRNLGGTEGVLQSLWPTIDLANAATQACGISVGMPYEWHNGNIKALTFYFAMDSSAVGNVRVRVRAATPADGIGTGSPAVDESFTLAADPTVGFVQKLTVNLPTPMAVTRGDVMLWRFERLGSDALDTHTGTMKVVAVALHYTADGPSAEGGGGGPWQVLDPTI